ncbi:hypothetical protein SAMN05192583_0894 [Sphingomonas gellani]|uniref:Uncharacterized protein n=1 Tax=Sphingomonas gellani TaxID=1166340 RepID=A0A1H7ZZJ2_9SPHN|nr:hypothetical protein [Sphingomonas gellani]SEM63008.1 hypothetical protein SAMN05192583_0894 [Sphingomonas gellani]
MTSMSPALDQALTGPTPTIFGAVEIVLPNHTIRLLTGSGIIVFDGKTFTGSDATYGVLHSVEDLTDGTGDEAPGISLTLVPAGDAAAADLARPEHQGAAVSIWLGAVEPSNGLVIGEPLLIFLGALDVPKLTAGPNSRLLELEITSAFEDFFFSDDGARLSDTFHRYVWPGERGMSFVTGVDEQIYWGGDNPSGVKR